MTNNEIGNYKKGTICTISRIIKSSITQDVIFFLSVNPKEYILAGKRDFTDDITNIRITHYECIKDGKVILSSNEPIEAESIDDFKANAKRLIQCDTVNVEFEKIES